LAIKAINCIKNEKVITIIWKQNEKFRSIEQSSAWKSRNIITKQDGITKHLRQKTSINDLKLKKITDITWPYKNQPLKRTTITAKPIKIKREFKTEIKIKIIKISNNIKTKTTSILLNVKIKSKMVNFLFIIGKCKKMA
jgi:hypothetical protein